MTLDELVAKWESEAAGMDRRSVSVAGGALVREFLADLAAARRDEAQELLTLPQAAAESGYSEGHIGRLVREGKVANAGRRLYPRIRRADLPRKPTAELAKPRLVGYDHVTDARGLLGRQRGARDG